MQVDKIPLWERPLVRDIAKLLAGLIVLLVLVLLVLRPLIRGLLARAARRIRAGGIAGRAGQLCRRARMAGAPLDYDGQISQARSLVTQDAARVAQVVKTWVGDDE